MNSFRIQNIKSFKDSGDIEIKPITILVGKNSCGKSSLLRFPALLSQTANFNGNNPPISFFGEYVDYGNFEDVVLGKSNNEMTFSLCYNIDISGRSRIVSDFSGIHLLIPDSQRDFLSLKKTKIFVTLRRVQKSIKVKEVSVAIDEQMLSKLYWDDNSGEFILELSSTYDNNKIVPVSEKIIFTRDEVSFEKFFPVYGGDIINAIIRTYDLYIESERYQEILKYKFLFARGIGDKIELTAKEMAIVRILKIFDYAAEIMKSIYDTFILESKTRISYIGPFRQNPGRIYRNSETARIHVGAKGENIGDILVGAYQKSGSSPLFNNISLWLEKYFGYSLNINDLGNNFFQLMLKDGNGIQSNIIDVGFGISQVLPIISEICVTALQGEENRVGRRINNIMLIEQPELHLHPAAQASLAELFAMCVSSNENSRLIIETHSEHLISKIQVLIADESNSLTNDMVQILYVDKDDTGTAFIREMKIKENGKFYKQWPTGFFDQGYTLSYELMKKSSSREKKGK